MRRHGWALGLALALACTPEQPRPDAGTGEDNTDTRNGLSPFTRSVLDGTGGELQPLALAVGPGDRVAVAYYSRVSDKDYEVRFIEWKDGKASASERIATVQKVSGLSVAYDSGGKAAVSYLGGGSDGTVGWPQSDLAISYRNAPGSWTENIAVHRSNEAATGNNLADSGFLVGINPAIVFAGTKAYVAYRDCHNGAFGRQDYESSDLELVEGSLGNWGVPRNLAMSGDTKAGYGGHISLVLGQDKLPALVHDSVPDSADGRGRDVFFQRRTSAGTWTAPLLVQTVSDTQLGASLAWDSVAGYGLAVVDRTSNKLTYKSSKDGNQWTEANPVFQSGAGGWYPSLAFDPVHHEPHIAFYVCSNNASANEQGCDAQVDELRIAAFIEDTEWRDVLVDAAGGWGAKLGFLSTGKRVVAYRDVGSGVVKLAVEP
jgi:hypothetical protein